MTPERWAQIEELFHRAAECGREERTLLLDVACGNDPELRREVEVLLSCDASAGDYVQAAVRTEIDAVGFPLAGETISHYRILDGLGGGGMGLVYRAEDIKLGRQVALKFLPEELASDPASLARFEREARSASALEHPNICPIYEFGEHEGRTFLVMQLLEGQTLRELLEGRNSKTSKSDSNAKSPVRHPLPLDQILDLAIQIADGLDAAHQRGIIHRDVKPANIFVTSQGQAKILDFGLAKLARGAMEEADESGRERDGSTRRAREDAPSAARDPLLSRTGVAMGTAGYMSPEQARGEKLDARTDIFSFGLVLYEMATGHRAFESDTGPALHNAILTQTPVPARRVNPSLPAKLGQIIAKALEKNRDARYQTVSGISTDLQLLKRKMERRNPLRRWALTAVLPAVLITGAILWFMGRRSWFRVTPPEVKLRQLTINSSENPVASGAISPDGKYLVYADLKGMHIKLIGSEGAQSIPTPEALKKSDVVWDIGFCAWLLGGDRFVANTHPATEDQTAWSSQTSSIWMFSVAGEKPRKIRDGAMAWSVSPDGSSIFFGTNKGKLGEREAWVMDSNGDQAHKLYEADAKTAICCVGWSPDQERYTYVSTDDTGDTMMSRDRKGGPPAILFSPSDTKKMNDFVWLHGGQLVYSLPESEGLSNACNYWTVRIDLRTGRRLDKPRRLTNSASFCMSSGTVSGDGKRLAFLGWSPGFGTAYVADLEAGGTRIRNSRRITLREDDEFIGDWTADSSTVIVGADRGDHYALYKQPLNSDSPEPIAPSVAGGLLTEAIVSPDGKWIIALVWPVSPGQAAGATNQPLPLVRIPIAGGAPELIFHMATPGPVSCAKAPSHLCVVAETTADNKQMVVTSFDPLKGRGLELARFDLDRDINLMVDNLFCVVSPDGTRLALTGSPDGPIGIHSLRGKPTKIIRAKGLDKLYAIAWAADGKALFVARHVLDGTELLHVDQRGNTTRLWKSLGPKCFGVPSPDGRHLAIYDWKRSSNMWMMENF
ncbi:MAG: protein kinase [Terriglobales bacterium]